MNAENLSDVVNKSAREHFRDLCKQTGDAYHPLMPTRLALRRRTPYPYRFQRRDSMFPEHGSGFGEVIFTDRETGFREIHRSIGESEEEHSWILIPDLSLWIDDTTESNSRSVGGDQYLITFLSHAFPALERVHTHPDKTVKQIQEEGGFTQNYLIEATTPSDSDMISHVQLFKRSNRNCRMISSIVSHYGVTTFELNEVGKSAQGYQFDCEKRDPVATSDKNPIDQIKQKLELFGNKQVELTFDSVRRKIFSISFAPLV